MLILTCKLGNEIINCYDGTHDKEQLKKWAKKKILLCPICGKPYEYCHGKVKTPYFRHLDKEECEYLYYEPETEEHINGKKDLFEWIKTQDGIINPVLEGWLPETKQRPDIMFEYNNQRYVIEYQCSPIATEFEERHALYNVIGIKDIWICGVDKYLQKNMKEKYIEKYSCGFYDPYTKQFVFNHDNPINPFVQIIETVNKRKNSKIISKRAYGNEYHYYTINLSDLIFDNEYIVRPRIFKNISYKNELVKHFDRSQKRRNDNYCSKKKYHSRFVKIMKNYFCDGNKYEISFVANDYDTFYLYDNKYTYENYEEIKLDHDLSMCDMFKIVINTIHRMVDTRIHVDNMNNIISYLEDRINGECEIYHKYFKNGEYIDVIYHYTIRFLIKNMCLDISIHDPDGYKRKNYNVFSKNDYESYESILNDIVYYCNIIYSNNIKIENVLDKITALSNSNWNFNYTISTFRLVEIWLSPVDDKGYHWSPIASLKININNDKKIDIPNMTEDELYIYVKNYFCWKMEKFFKSGIKRYCDSNKRLIIKNMEVHDN